MRRQELGDEGYHIPALHSPELLLLMARALPAFVAGSRCSFCLIDRVCPPARVLAANAAASHEVTDRKVRRAAALHVAAARSPSRLAAEVVRARVLALAAGLIAIAVSLVSAVDRGRLNEIVPSSCKCDEHTDPAACYSNAPAPESRQPRVAAAHSQA